MSDEEDFMMSEAESYEFEFEDDDEEMDEDQDGSSVGGSGADGEGDDGDEEDNSAEGLYYNGKNVKHDNLEGALAIFKKILDVEDNGDRDVIEYKFKAIKQILKIEYNLDKIDDFLQTFKKSFQLDLSKLAKNYVDDSLGRILDRYIGLDPSAEYEFLETFINNSKSNERSILRAQLKKCQVLLDLKRFGEVTSLLTLLYKKLDSMPEVTKNTHLLELYSIEIQIHSQTSNNVKLKELYNKTLSIQSTIPHPKINAIIKECGGKMYLRDENYDLASNEFYESFKNYDEIGNQPKRVNILKYLIISSILSDGEINKFESQETKYFLKDEQVLKYVKLLKSFDSLKNDQFEKLLQELLELEKEDSFLLYLLYKVESVLKLRLLIHYIKPFKRLSLDKLSSKLQLSIDDIEDIFLSLKNNGKLQTAKLDLIDGIVYNE